MVPPERGVVDSAGDVVTLGLVGLTTGAVVSTVLLPEGCVVDSAADVVTLTPGVVVSG